jgi:hypothetical protein
MRYNFFDHTYLALRNADVPQESKAQLWDLVQAAKSPADVAQQLQAHDISPDLKTALVDAKQRQMPVPETSLEKTIDALNSIGRVENLDAVENHPALNDVVKKLG